MTALTSDIPQMCTHCLYFWNFHLFHLGSWTVFAVFIQANKTEHILRIFKSLRGFMPGICIWAWRFHPIFGVFESVLSVIRPDVSALVLPWPGGGMFLKALRDFFTRPYCGKMSGRFATYPSRIVSSWDPVKSRISTLGCPVLYILRVMGFWEIAEQKHFMNIL